MPVAGLFITLFFLALFDSTSFGTLIIPVWLLMAAERIRFGRICAYLLTVYLMYFAVGIAILFGAGIFFEYFAGFIGTRAFYAVLFGIGVIFFVLSFRYDPKRIAARKAKSGKNEGRFLGWRNKVLTDDKSPSGSLILLAGGAVSVEILTMFPYLAAIGLLTGAGFSLPEAIGILAGYCVIMILPALILIFVRLLFHNKISPLLHRIDAWFAKHAETTLGWMLAIVGVVLILNTIGPLGLNELLSDFGITIG